MTEDFIKIISLLILIPIFLSIAFAVSNMFTEQKCAPYISTIDQQKTTIKRLNETKNKLTNDLQQCRDEYDRLIRENITKRDIEEIKSELNITKSDVNILSQKFETVNNNFVAVYNNLYFYFSVAVILNVFFIFLIIGDLISVAFLKIDIKRKLIDLLVSKFKKKRRENA